MNRVWKVLTKAANLISDRENWIAGEEHRVVKGRHKYCAMGALMAASTALKFDNTGAPLQARELLDEVAHEQWPEMEPDAYDGIVWVNDRHGHEAVMAVFEKAIVRAQEIIE